MTMLVSTARLISNLLDINIDFFRFKAGCKNFLKYFYSTDIESEKKSELTSTDQHLTELSRSITNLALNSPQ